ncbi:hypothetical protein [Archangium sp.]|uniref:hypothetical protein n=1 Tax=Archangium sp. TaxID=1872627 RepID=UPI00389A3AFE
MYSIQEVLNNIDAKTAIILASGIVVLVGAFLMYGEAIRLGFRDKTHSIPLFANMYFFAHDLFFVAKYDYWFHGVGHWLFKLFWVALLVFTLLELVVHYQTLKYSRKELFPMLTQAQYVLVYVALQGGVVVLFWFVYSVLEDPLFLINFALTEILSSTLLLPLLWSRRSAQGQSMLLGSAVLVGADVGYFLLLLPLMAHEFATPVIYSLGGVLAVLTLGYLWALRAVRRGVSVSPAKALASRVMFFRRTPGAMPR